MKTFSYIVAATNIIAATVSAAHGDWSLAIITGVIAFAAWCHARYLSALDKFKAKVKAEAEA